MNDLISPVALAALMGLVDGTEHPVLLDVRWSLVGPAGADLYRQGHVPGAVFVDLDRDLAGDPGPHGRHPMPEPDALQASMRRWGIHSDTLVVAYDAADGTSAARAWWLLRWAGHTDVRVLDGGWAAWRAAGLPVDTTPPLVRPGSVVVHPGGMPVLDADAVAKLARTGIALDARSTSRYAGLAEPVDPVAGHIPGAISAPTTDNVDGTGRFLPAERLRERFSRLGVDRNRPVGAYCGSGVTAAHEVLALRLAGFDAGLYVGSWSEWITDPGRPVAVAPSPAGDRAGPAGG